MKKFKAFTEMATLAKMLTPIESDDVSSSHDISKYEDKNGNTIFVKFPNKSLYEKSDDSDIHILVEYLAYKIYDIFGIKTPKNIDLIIRGDEIGLGTGVVIGRHPSFEELKGLQTFARGFATDCFLANWDVTGTSRLAANIIIDAEGNIFRIDPGGTLTFRARGERKGDKFSDKVGEVDTLRDPKLSVAADAYNSNLKEVKKSFENFFSVSWSKFKRELDSFNNEYIIKELMDKLESPESKEKILSNWAIEYKQIMTQLERRYDNMKTVYERM